MYVRRVLNLQMQVLLAQWAVCGATAELARDEAEASLAAARFEVAVNAWGVDDTGTLPVSAALTPLASGGQAGLAIVLPGGAKPESAKNEHEVPGASSASRTAAKPAVVPETTNAEGATIKSELVPESTPTGAKESAPTSATEPKSETKLGGAEPAQSDGKADIQSVGATPDVQSDSGSEPAGATPDVQLSSAKEPQAAAHEPTDPATAPKAGLLEEAGELAAGGTPDDAEKLAKAVNTGSISKEDERRVIADEIGRAAQQEIQAGGDKVKEERILIASQSKLELDKKKEQEAIKALKEIEKQEGNGVYLVLVALAAA